MKDAPKLSQESYTQVNSISIWVFHTPELFEKPNARNLHRQYGNTMILGHLENTKINLMKSKMKGSFTYQGNLRSTIIKTALDY